MPSAAAPPRPIPAEAAPPSDAPPPSAPLPPSAAAAAPPAGAPGRQPTAAPYPPPLPPPAAAPARPKPTLPSRAKAGYAGRPALLQPAGGSAGEVWNSAGLDRDAAANGPGVPPGGSAAAARPAALLPWAPCGCGPRPLLLDGRRSGASGASGARGASASSSSLEFHSLSGLNWGWPDDASEPSSPLS